MRGKSVQENAGFIRLKSAPFSWGILTHEVRLAHTSWHHKQHHDCFSHFSQLTAMWPGIGEAAMAYTQTESPLTC